jgi:hypothetical protein
VRHRAVRVGFGDRVECRQALAEPEGVQQRDGVRTAVAPPGCKSKPRCLAFRCRRYALARRRQ